ncbi:hypothetical protein ACWOBW_02010 [Gemella sanguinis]
MSKERILISRILLAIITIIVLTVVFFYKPEPSEEDIKIREDQDRIVEYIKEKVELQNKEEIKKIKFTDYEKNYSTGTWNYDVVINDKIELYYTSWRERKEVVLTATKEGDINLVENKKNMNESNIEVIYEK